MQCEHVGCVCTVEGDSYCSDHCRDHAAHDQDPHTCECGHAECVAAQAAGSGAGGSV